MRKRLILFLIIFIMFSGQAMAGIEEKITNRIMYVHSTATPNSPIGFYRANQYAKEIIRVSDKYDLDPLLFASIAEAEGNYVNKGRFPDGGRGRYSLGLWHMQETTAKWMYCDILEFKGEYSDWKVIEPTYLGAELAAGYFRWLLNRYDGDILKALYAWNVGNARGVKTEMLTHNLTIRILGIYEIYKSD